VIFSAKLVKQSALSNGRMARRLIGVKRLRLLRKFVGVAGRRRRAEFSSAAVENARQAGLAAGRCHPGQTPAVAFKREQGDTTGRFGSRSRAYPGEGPLAPD